MGRLAQALVDTLPGIDDHSLAITPRDIRDERTRGLRALGHAA